MPFPEIDLTDYYYHLPEERIAKYPLEKRSESKLLVYRQGNIIHSRFNRIDEYLPAETSLYLNNTRVIPARLHFYKSSGAHIEIFLLGPVAPYTDIAQSMQARGYATWECKIGNKKKWKSGQTITLLTEFGMVECRLVSSVHNHVEFRWPELYSLAEILEAAGKIPLPPYLKRDSEESDKERYQTTYATSDGAVAAPTAGLHFTPELLKRLKINQTPIRELTLHVSAGTFQPISAGSVAEHPMHYEQIDVERKVIENLCDDTFVVAVGTTSLRTLESLYWFGTMLQDDPALTSPNINKEIPYAGLKEISVPEAMTNILRWMDQRKIQRLTGTTGIFIVPGYRFRIVKGLITNYHLPGSTLILLVAALTGQDWRLIYREALEKGYRFLSYGDSSLLIP